MMTADHLFSASSSDCQVSERRSAPRVPYDISFQVAFAPGVAPLRFVNVWGNDVSPVGISFFSANRPNVDEIILLFGESTRVNARVVHCREVEQEGRMVNLVGCEFVRM